MKRNSAMLEPHERILARLWILVFVSLVAVAGLGALEPDELRPGMDAWAVVSVYTSHRACSNSVFLEQPGFMSWDAQLFNRSAKIEVRFDQELASIITIRIFLEPDDDGADVLSQLVSDHARVSGPPAISADRNRRWVSGSLVVELAVEAIDGIREVRLVLSTSES